MTVSDFELRHDVEAELDWDTRLDSRQIGVAVKDGIVALSGYVSSYLQRQVAEQAAQRISGVRAVANDIVVELPGGERRSDAELADAAEKLLREQVSVPADRVRLTVHGGWVVLSGEVLLWHQRQAAEQALAGLAGLKGITNNIAISSQPSEQDVRTRIEDALRRRAQLDGRQIRVSTRDGTVTLEGHVGSWPERQQAETAAWQAPGVKAVIDLLEINP